ncbi:hypothetical protein [Salisediminibacterium beveridgei]|uniref:Uncharacterized protein n=1 Tax=Salisediminibacterium beveridgei TaxID=632773 RepID=A0A1D7QZP7_9BACI|nr:hypothetical protein [Salisediminibacterium beveridgei]AOM84484.1 hypothetical protein BBEV_3168 [Salisediminibacterium beveridgei]
MKSLIIMMAGMILFTACQSPNYDKDEVIAELNGEEIKVEEVLWQFSLEEDPEDMMTHFLKQEIMLLEAKDMGIVVSEEEIEESKQAIFPDTEAAERYELTDDKDFHEKQASKLDISPEEYFEAREERMYKVQAYTEKYIEAEFGYPSDSDEIDEWGEKIDSHFESLFDRYKEDGKLIIKF